MEESRMFVQLACVALLASRSALACSAESADALLAALGGDRLSVCGAGGARCPAALWRRRWAVARLACVGARHPPAPAPPERVLRDRDGDTCATLHEGATGLRARTVEARSVRRGRGGGLALLQLDRAYDEADVSGNYSTATRLLEEFAPWMDKVYTTYWIRAYLDQLATSVKAQRPLLLSSPLITFCSTMLLPMLLFIAFFLFVTFCTGTPISSPYQNIDQYVPTSPWIEYKYSRNAVKRPSYI